jgi:hypothetical protein
MTLIDAKTVKITIIFVSYFMKKKFNIIDLVLMLPAVIALIYGFVSTT